MSNFNFTSQVCTTREQSERLIKLGIKKETADMVHQCTGVGAYKVWDKSEISDDFFPAWSLHRLIEMYKSVEDISLWSLEYVNYNRLIEVIGLAIKHGAFNKEYLV